MKSTWLQTNFNGGEWSPLAYGRADLAKQKNGLAECLNYLPTQQGPLTRRPGTRHVAPVKDHAVIPRLQEFEFSVEQAYVLEFGENYIRFFANDAQLTNSGTPYEVATPYSAVDVWALGFTQSADTLYITHPSHPTAKLQRVASTPAHVWTLTEIPFMDGPYLNVNATNTTLTPEGSSSSGGTCTIFDTTMTLDTAPTVGALEIGQTLAIGSYTAVIESLDSGTLNVAGSTYTMSLGLTTVFPATFITYTPLVGGLEIVVTASSTDGINGSVGFRTEDLGRLLRIKCGGVWLWGPITEVTDSTHIKWTVSDPTGDQLPVTARATANVSGGSVFGITILDGGSGYGAQPPNVNITGGGGSGAVAFATLTNGVVTGIVMSVTGTGYTSTPTVTIAAPAGVIPSSTAFWRLGLWNSVDGYPSCVTFHQDRLCLAGALNSPGRLDGSNSGDYENFAPTNLDGTVTDANALAFTLNSSVVNSIVWMVSDEWGMLIGTAGGEWVVAPSNTQQAITPTNVNAKPLSNYGSTNVAPIRVGKATLFVQRTKRKLREMFYQFTNNSFQAFDISLISEHLTESGLKQMAVQLAPQQLLWIGRNNGKLAGVTYDKDQETCGWHGHRIGGFSDAAQTLPPLVGSVASIPSPDTTRDEVWCVVKRYINGAAYCSVEVMAKLWENGDTTPTCCFLDGSAEYNGVPTTTISGLTWLKGQTVGVLADGSVHPDRVVDSSGGITLDYSASIVQVGLRYTSRARTLCIESGGADGPSQGKLKRIHRAVIRFFQSIGLTVGSSTAGVTAYPEPFRTSVDLMDSPVSLFDGDKRWSYEGSWGTEGSVTFETSDPLPSNITMLMVQLDTQDAQ